MIRIITTQAQRGGKGEKGEKRQGRKKQSTSQQSAKPMAYFEVDE
jgi:hypothetical protein